MNERRIVFVDDDATLRRVLSREIGAFGYEVEAFDGPAGLLERVREWEPHAALVDLRLPQVQGLELLHRLREADPALPIVMLTGHGAVRDAVEAMRHGAYDFLTKPVSLDVLETVLRRATEHRDLLEENRRLRRFAEPDEVASEILGEHERTRELRALVERVASRDATVLILGEHGTGKELVARAIHDCSPRRDHPFVVVHSGAVPEALVESELFGHERGAFTGADRKRVGLFEAAHGGTIFLDEIGELPLQVQPVLLRVLQSGEIRPVGSSRTRQVDVRVVAATNRDLLGEVESGGFREDLYYRLATIVIDVPPLRERRSDVPALARVFLEREQAQESERLELDDSALEALSRHDWPGNIRELQNAVARLATLAAGPRIRAEDVERHVNVRRRPGGAVDLPTLDLDELEALAIRKAMQKHGGKKRPAAAELGVALKTLYNKLAKMPELDEGNGR